MAGRNVTSSTPEAKFDKDPCSARPIASPAAPIAATNEAVGMPSWPSAAIATISSSTTKAMFDTKPTTVGSSPRAAMTRPATVTSRPAIHLPTNRIASAASRFSP